MSGVKGETPIRRHKIDGVDIYDITKEEINGLTGNSSAELLLNISISCISIVATLLAALLTCGCSDVVKIIFIVLTVILTLTAIWLFILWRSKRKDVLLLKQKILNR